jgi:hypothetical protein
MPQYFAAFGTYIERQATETLMLHDHQNLANQYCIMNI